ALTSAPVLLIPDPNKPFSVTTDASDIAIGAILCQDQGKGDQPVAYEFRKLMPAELNYPVHEKELLAVIHALKVWRVYLEGRFFQVTTDHESLKYLHSQAKLSRRQARWVETLQAYDFVIKYRLGKTNVVADTLSRKPEINSISEVHIDEELYERIKEEYEEDAHFQKILKALEDPSCDEAKRRYLEFNEGDIVMLNSANLTSPENVKRPTKKFLPKFIGPFKIIRKISTTAYQLELPDTLLVHPVFYISLLKLYHPNEFEDRDIAQPPTPVIREHHSDPEFEVEGILDKRIFHRQVQYLVKWKGYPLYDATWEPLTNLENCKDLVKNFEAQEEIVLNRGECKGLDVDSTHR
ncbi:13399_t:CDS:2, partial [Cetraspora pellucida]